MGYQRESFQRGPELERRPSALPATAYNLSRLLLADSPSGCLFVPIRSMQFQAVLDREEIIFVDSQFRRSVVLAWREFQPSERASLDQPVPYQAVFHRPDGALIQRRLQVELFPALRRLAERRELVGTGRVLPFRRPG